MKDLVQISTVGQKRPERIRFELIGDDAPTGGLGGWESLPRSRRNAAAGYIGPGEQTYTLPLMLTGYGPARSTSIEPDLRVLRSWATAPDKPTDEPPVLTVTGPLIVPATWRWVLQDIGYGERFRDDAGVLVQLDVTLTLLRYLEPRLVKSPASRSRSRRGNKNDKGKKKNGGR